MIKHLTIPVLGLVILVGAVAPAAADHRGSYVYSYDAQPQKSATKRSVQRHKFNPKLDFETEAVWRNLRPEWFAE
jgi:hypothetical protein